jgi:hypothetical protein
MRIVLTALTAGLLAAGAATVAQAKPAAVSVQVAPQLQAKAAKTYGVRDIDQLAGALRADVERQLARTGAYQDASVELVLADAVPNRPTVKQMGARPGLSFRSLGVGGARIEGRIVGADGRVTPVHFQYYSATLRDVTVPTTWGDAGWTFQRFAYELGRGRPTGG